MGVRSGLGTPVESVGLQKPEDLLLLSLFAAAFVDTTNHLRYSSAIRVKANREVDLTRCPYAKPHAN
jgi:hypothetical protein